MSSLQDIVRRHAISETEIELKKQGFDYETIPKMINCLAKNSEINRKVDMILNALRDEIEMSSLKKK